MNPHFFTAPFSLLSFGSGFKVQGSGGGFAAFFRRWYSRIAAFPSRGRLRYEKNALRSPSGIPPRCELVEEGHTEGSGWMAAI